MKKIFLFVFFLYLSITNLFAQHRGDNWCFPDSVLLTFNGTGAPIISSSVLKNSVKYNAAFGEVGTGVGQWSCACISKENGQLEFYTDGFTVWNRNHQVMLNGDSLLCQYYTSADHVLIIPYPDHDSLYFIFNYILSQTSNEGESYSVVNINEDGGLGGIVDSLKNIYAINDTLGYCTAAIQHGNGRDWWIIGHDRPGNSFFKILVTPNGIEGPFWQNIGSNYPTVFTSISVSPNGNKIGLANMAVIEVFDFDRCTGNISNVIEIGTIQPNSICCSFSPDGSKFYVSNTNDLFQYDLNEAIPMQSQTLIWHNPYSQFSYPNDSAYAIGDHELAPDGKIYISNYYKVDPELILHFGFQNMSLSVINEPDSLGLACDFQPYSLYLGGHRTHGGLPNMPNYNLGKLVGSPCDTLTSIQNENLKTKSLIRIFPNPATEQLTIDNGQFTITEIEITDVMGKIIYKEESLAHLSIIHCQLFSAGIYFVKVYMNDGSVEVRKFVKE